MNEQLESDFNRVNLSSKDFEEAHQYLSGYSPDLSLVLQRALLTAAVIAYARPFTKNRGHRDGLATARLPIAVADVLDHDKRALHNRIIDLRDRGIAHSDYSLKPTRRVARQDTAIMTWSKPFDILSELIDVQAFRDLAWAMHCHCVNAIFALGKQLQDQSTTAPLDARSELPDGAISLRIPLSAFAPLSSPPKDATAAPGAPEGESGPSSRD